MKTIPQQELIKVPFFCIRNIKQRCMCISVDNHPLKIAKPVVYDGDDIKEGKSCQYLNHAWREIIVDKMHSRRLIHKYASTADSAMEFLKHKFIMCPIKTPFIIQPFTFNIFQSH